MRSRHKNKLDSVQPERKYNLERVKLADVEEQITLATIRAERPGLVVYGASDQNSSRYRGNSSQEAIQEGATVRERQAILTIPDMREMAIKVNIHESAVQRVAVGQAVSVSIDALSRSAIDRNCDKSGSGGRFCQRFYEPRSQSLSYYYQN